MLRYLTQGKLDAFYVGEEGRTLLHFAAIVSIMCVLYTYQCAIAFLKQTIDTIDYVYACM